MARYPHADDSRLRAFVDLLAGAAHADGVYRTEEHEEIEAIVREQSGADKLSWELRHRIRKFDPQGLDIPGACRRLGLPVLDLESAKIEARRSILASLIRVSRADDIVDTRESAYFKQVTRCLGAQPEEYGELVTEPEALRDFLLTPAVPCLAVNEVLGGRYALREFLATGAYGQVYRADDQRLEYRDVAIKLFRRDATPNELARFRREALLASAVCSPHIVEVHDFGTLPDGQGYLVMELLEGESLDDRLERENKLPWPNALDIADGMLAGLEAAHAANVVHRDLKPDNVFLVTAPGVRDHVKILDLGAAFVMEHAPADLGVDEEESVTSGAPLYMAPEQFSARPVDHKADLYGVAVMLYEMLTGELPHPAVPLVGRRSSLLSDRIALAEDIATLRSHGLDFEGIDAVDELLRENLRPEAWRRTCGRAGDMRARIAKATGRPAPPPAVRRGERRGTWVEE